MAFKFCVLVVTIERHVFNDFVQCEGPIFVFSPQLTAIINYYKVTHLGIGLVLSTGTLHVFYIHMFVGSFSQFGLWLNGLVKASKVVTMYGYSFLLQMDKPELRRYVCDTCGSVYQSSSNLRRHMEKHTDKKAYCHCGASFTYKESLQRHMKAVHLGGYKCKHCHEIFTSQTTLSVHSRKVHTKNPLQVLCYQSFYSLAHLSL